MQNRAATMFRIAALAAAMSLAACEGSQEAELAKLDNQITGNETDPALTSALEDQILVDPALTQQSNRNAVRPPETPTQAQYPLPSRPASVQGSGGAAEGGGDAVRSAAADCGPELDHGARWVRDLPPAFAPYPGARITDAAGKEVDGCRLRVVTFTTSGSPERVLEHYRSRAIEAGYSAERQMREGDHILAGAQSGGDGAFYLIVTPQQSGGSDVAMIASKNG